MYKSIRNILLPLFAVLVMVCIILSTSLLVIPSKAYAAVGETSGFYVEDGASVRSMPDKEGRTGIRFITVISQEFYEAHEGDTWGVIWGKNLAEGTELELADVNTDGSVKSQEGISPTESSDGNYEIRLVIHFNEIMDQAEKIAAYNTKLTVRAYVKDTETGVVEYAETNGDARSAKEVAEKVLLDDKIGNEQYTGTDHETTLKMYANASYVETKTTEAYIVKNGNNYEITSAAEEFTTDKALYFNNNEISALSSLTEAEVGDLTLGEYYSLAYVKEDGCIVQQPVQYVTEIITTDNIVDIIQKQYFYSSGKVYNYNGTITDGKYADANQDEISLPTEMPYYVLAGDVTFIKDVKSGTSNSGYGTSFQYNPIFHGVLDGKGYTITVESNDSSKRLLRGGVFGYLAEGSKIKNVELLFPSTCKVNTFGSAGAIGFNLLGDNEIENVVISIADFSFNTAAVRPLVAGTINNAKFKDVFINVYYIGTPASTLATADMVGIGGGFNGATFDNVHILLPTDFAEDTSGKKLVAYNSTTEYYANGYTADGDYEILDNVSVHEAKAVVPNTIGIWTIDTGETVASTNFATGKYTATTVKDAFYFERVNKVQLNEEAYLQADGTLVGIEENLTTVTIDGVDCTLSYGKVAGFSGVLGEVYCMEYTVGSTIYTRPVQYVTEVITNANLTCSATAHPHTDFNRITQLLTETYYYTGGKVYDYNPANTEASAYTSGDAISLPTELPYYVLGEDVTFTKPVDNYGGNWYPIFHGVLDGKGHSISFATVDKNNAKRTLSGGMFNYLSKGSALTNVEILFPKQVTSNGKRSGLSSGAIAKEFLGNNRLENVVISINNVAFTGSGSQALVANVLNNVTMQDVVINVKTMPEDDATTLDVIGIGGGLADGYSFEKVRIYTSEAYSGNTTSKAGFALIAGIDYSSGKITNADYEVDGITVSNLTDNTTTEPTTVGTWSIDTTSTTNIGADAMAGYVSEEFKAENLSTTNKTVSVEDGTFKVDKLVSSKGVYSGIIRFSIDDESIVTYDIETNTFTAIADGTTTVKYSYIIDGVVYAKQFTVNVTSNQ